MATEGKKSTGSFYLAKNENTLGSIDLSKLIDTFTAFIETKIALLKWDAQEEVHVFLSKAIILCLIFAVIGLAIIFLSIGLAIGVNFWMDSDYLGFVAVAVLYLFFALLILLGRKNIESRIQRSLNQTIEQQKAQKNE